MLASMIWPCPDQLLSRRASTIPNAQMRPPPAKSATKFNGAYGFSELRPSMDSSPITEREGQRHAENRRMAK